MAMMARSAEGPVPPASDHVQGPDHRVQFYETDDFFYRVVGDFFSAGQERGEPLVVIATDVHRQGLLHHLALRGFDVDRLRGSGGLVLLDARETLSTFMVDGMPAAELFKAKIGAAIAEMQATSRTGHVRAVGEMVDLLWADGNHQAVMALETLWKDLRRGHSFSLLCLYGMPRFHDEAYGAEFQGICRTHTQVGPAEDYPVEGDSEARLRAVTFLQQRAGALESEVLHRKRLEKVLREALAERQRAEQALRVSQQELLDFFENGVEGLHCVGPDGIILSANRAEFKLFGYTKEEYIGHNIAEFHVDP
jgi:PAS domain-containing protein